MVVDHFRSFQVTLDHFRSFQVGHFRSFQIILGCFRSFQIILGHFRSFQVIPCFSNYAVSSSRAVGTFSNADFCDGDGDRKSNLFPVDVLHFGGKPLSLRADVRTASFPLFTKREYILCFYGLNIYHFFLIWFPKASKRTRQYKIGI